MDLLNNISALSALAAKLASSPAAASTSSPSVAVDNNKSASNNNNDKTFTNNGTASSVVLESLKQRIIASSNRIADKREMPVLLAQPADEHQAVLENGAAASPSTNSVSNGNHQMSLDRVNNGNSSSISISNNNGKSPESDSQTRTRSPVPEQPDHDAIKMFVGQVPRSMDEAELRVMFEEFGHVYQINVLRDKTTGQSKGCCFVTFYKRKAALEAQNALHNVKTLPGMHHPIQMKPADTENRNERKLFVGMVSKKFNESDVKTMFNQFGTIEECTVLRDTNGISKGCAFVTFSSRQNAITAIKAMHHSQTMEGCSSPMVVKFADTQKDKEQKKVQQLQSNLWNLSAINPSAATSTLFGQGQLIPTLSLQQALNGSVGAVQPATAATLSPYAAGIGQNPQLSQHMLALQQLLAVSSGQQGQTAGQGNAGSLGSYGISNGAIAGATGLSNLGAYGANIPGFSSLTGIPQSGQQQQQQNVIQSFGLTPSTTTSSAASNLALLAAATNPAAAAAAAAAVAGGFNPAAFNQGLSGNSATPGSGISNPSAANQAQAAAAAAAAAEYAAAFGITDTSALQLSAGIPTLLASTPPTSTTSVSPSTSNTATASAAPATGLGSASPPGLRQHEGPEGANLFIYHLPQEFTDSDLLQTFSAFGNVVSAKVFIDKQTNLSKCFGFVSYDNPVSAAAAIQAMNGFQVGSKRLKVQLKRSRDAGKPY